MLWRLRCVGLRRWSPSSAPERVSRPLRLPKAVSRNDHDRHWLGFPGADSGQSQLRLATRSSVSIAAFELPGSSGNSMITS